MCPRLRNGRVQARTVPLIEDIRELVVQRIALADQDPDGRLLKGRAAARITMAVLRDATARGEVCDQPGA
jgi:hypothetical protein